MKILFVFILVLLLGGCSPKVPMQKLLYEKSVTHSKKGVILNGLVPKIHIIATYVSIMDEKTYNKYDTFVISLHFENDAESFEDAGVYRLYTQKYIKNNQQVIALKKEVTRRSLRKEEDKVLTNIKKELRQLSQTPPQSILKLNTDADILKYVPSSNSWSSYYQVNIKKTKLTYIPLTLEHKEYGSVTLTFQKDILTK